VLVGRHQGRNQRNQGFEGRQYGLEEPKAASSASQPDVSDFGPRAIQVPEDMASAFSHLIGRTSLRRPASVS
jgi:hypothetical protein